MGVVAGRNGPQHGELIGVTGQPRHQLAKLNAGHIGGNRVDFAADISRCVGLRIPGRLLWRPAHQEQNDARFRLPASSTVARQIATRRRPGRQQVFDRKPEQPQAARVEHLPSRKAIAKPCAGMSQRQHRRAPDPLPRENDSSKASMIVDFLRKSKDLSTRQQILANCDASSPDSKTVSMLHAYLLDLFLDRTNERNSLRLNVLRSHTCLCKYAFHAE
jgi:hypothetical protein